MPVRLLEQDLSPRLLVIAPILVLSLISAGLLAVLGFNGWESAEFNHELLLVGAVVYAVAIALLIRFGLVNIGTLERIGLTDSLTLLPNRRALHRDIKAVGTEGEVALALIDLDGFKQVNDHYGHFTGDLLIKQCALLLNELCGEEGRSYRLGGDEFAVMMAGPIAGNILEGTCRILLERLQQAFRIEDNVIVVGASVGMARCKAGPRVESSELLRQTDVAMYASKRAGKMRCTWFSKHFDHNREAIREIDNELRAALESDEFRLHYQPVVDATSKAVVAVEALIRWERADGKRVGPDVFIPIAEESGFINAIGIWVLRQACTDALAWEGLTLSVNVSAAQLRNPEFPVQLGHILEETGFPAERLELEVTETYLVHEPEIAARNLDVIRHFGVRIVLDDFGTGYASIGFLRQFRFEKLKLDRSLVVDATKDGGSQAMMVASIAVARAMHMDVTAEGVENQAQADMVRIAGCDQIQGWLYFKAMPAADIDAYFLAKTTQRMVS